MIYANNDARLDFLLSYLMEENAQARGIGLPSDTLGKRRLLRALMNVREAGPASDEFLSAQDEELQCQLAEKGVVSVQGEGLKVWQGDITRLQVDAIVNAANSKLLGCFVPLHGCIDNAIHSAAGIQLRSECDEIMRRQGHDEPTGQAKLTRGYNLPARFVIHTVGPIIHSGAPSSAEQQLLASCYRESLLLADAHELQSIAFCCISTGEFHFPNELAAEIAIAETRRCLQETKHIRQVIFNVFKDVDKDIYTRLLA